MLALSNMFSWVTNGYDSSSAESSEGEGTATPPEDLVYESITLTDGEIPGTLAYFQALKKKLESQLIYPKFEFPSYWTESLQCSQAAQASLDQANKVLEELQKHKDTVPPEQITQAQKAIDSATSFLEEAKKTVSSIAKSLLTENAGEGDVSIKDFVSSDFDDSSWTTFIVMQDPNHWAQWCCPNNDKDDPDPVRVAIALEFLHDVAAQRRVLANGGPRCGNYGGYLELLPQLVSSAARKEPVLERLAQAIALEFAERDFVYFDTTTPIDPVGRYIHYEQAYLMGDLDPAFSTFEIWELRYAVNSPCRDWELQWGRECLQTYRPDWALTDDPQWRYCRLVRLDVGYMQPTFTSRPITMDQILSGGGECGPVSEHLAENRKIVNRTVAQ